MKKTLLLTTALIGTLSVLGTANAEIKIGGGVKTAWKTAESLTSTGAAAAGFSQERQIDFSTSGTLNNGLKYSAGFSMEQDGGDGAFDGSEGNYVNVSFGDTTIELGNDHIALNSDYNIVPRAGAAINEEIDGYGGLVYAQSYGKLKEGMGIGVVQKVTGGAVMFNFYPRAQQKAESGDTTVNTSTGTPGYEASYGGKIQNLDLFINYRTRGKDALEVQDQKNKKIGAAYTMGSVKVGYEYSDNDDAAGTNRTMNEIGAVLKISDNSSIGIGRTTTQVDDVHGRASGSKEKINYLQVGYSLGAIGTQLSYIDTENLGTVAARDPKAIVLKVNTKF